MYTAVLTLRAHRHLTRRPTLSLKTLSTHHESCMMSDDTYVQVFYIIHTCIIVFVGTCFCSKSFGTYIFLLNLMCPSAIHPHTSCLIKYKNVLLLHDDIDSATIHEDELHIIVQSDSQTNMSPVFLKYI